MIMSENIHLALPVLNEYENMPLFLDCLRRQTNRNFILWVCVNNYDSWHDDVDKKEQVENNLKTIELLKSIKDIKINIIDKASIGKGWKGKKGGVGMARKTVMDAIAEKASSGDDLIISMDADTFYPENYIEEIKKSFEKNQDIIGLSVPYYHKLTGNEENDRLILRYEIYMRNYILNMLRISNPYAFSALGSAMAFPVWAYKKVGGMTPVLSGEDFYFLQKLAKNGKILIHTGALAEPSARLSDRVIFGTGPALIKGASGDWSSYPVYHYSIFEKIKGTFELFPVLFDKDVATTMDDFLKEQFKTDDIWGPLRKNYKDKGNFVKACVNRIDGLRILQFLRQEQKKINLTDDEILEEFLLKFFKDKMDESFQKHLKGFDFYGSALCFTDLVRDFMFERETELREKLMFCGNVI